MNPVPDRIHLSYISKGGIFDTLQSKSVHELQLSDSKLIKTKPYTFSNRRKRQQVVFPGTAEYKTFEHYVSSIYSDHQNQEIGTIIQDRGTIPKIGKKEYGNYEFLKLRITDPEIVGTRFTIKLGIFYEPSEIPQWMYISRVDHIGHRKNRFLKKRVWRRNDLSEDFPLEQIINFSTIDSDAKIYVPQNYFERLNTSINKKRKDCILPDCMCSECAIHKKKQKQLIPY